MLFSILNCAHSYGEQGFVVIHQTLYDLFPPTSISPDTVSPLTPAEFIQKVLVPEAAVLLISNDLRLGYDQAVATLRESSRYGVAMFPDTSHNTTGEDIVKQRAETRKKELDQEHLSIATDGAFRGTAGDGSARRKRLNAMESSDAGDPPTRSRREKKRQKTPDVTESAGIESAESAREDHSRTARQTRKSTRNKGKAASRSPSITLTTKHRECDTDIDLCSSERTSDSECSSSRQSGRPKTKPLSRASTRSRAANLRPPSGMDALSGSDDGLNVKALPPLIAARTRRKEYSDASLDEEDIHQTPKPQRRVPTRSSVKADLPTSKFSASNPRGPSAVRGRAR
jgi:hypothetical protein